MIEPQNNCKIKFFSIDKQVCLAADAVVAGNVEIGRDSSVWFHAVIRSERDRVIIGERTNIQDGCVIHTDDGFPCTIGDDVVVGHRAVLHGCTVGNGTLIGMGAIVLNGATIGSHCMIGAGALVTSGTVIPDGMLAFGSPAKVIRPLTDEEIRTNLLAAEEYVRLAKEYFGYSSTV